MSRIRDEIAQEKILKKEIKSQREQQNLERKNKFARESFMMRPWFAESIDA